MTDINQETKSQPFISKCIVDTHCKVRINVSQTYVIDCFSQTCLRVNYIITLIITLPGSTVQTERITFGSLNLQTTQSASQCIFIKSFSQLFYSLLIRSNITKNQIVSIDVPLSTGYFANNINAGKIANKGVEVTLGLTPVETRNFKWDLDATFASQISYCFRI